MFGSSKQMMFRHIQALQRFKIHQPLPMNPRESQQLLNLLTTSFRQQLDREHGGFRDEDALEKAQKGSLQAAKGTRRRRASTGQIGRGTHQPTDRHLHSILTNPLFGYDLGNAKQNMKDPMKLFEEGVARGVMTIESATACLEAEKNVILRSASLTIRDGMEESGAGLKVLRWLKSSGTANNTTFLRDHAFISIFFRFLVAEGLESHIWTWLKQEFKAASEQEYQQKDMKALAYPLFHLIKAQAADFASLDAAYVSMRRAVDCLMATSATIPLKGQHMILGPSGRFLSYESTASESRLRRPTSDAVAYNKFLSTIPSFTSAISRHGAYLRLHHPIRPDAMPLLKYVNQDNHFFQKYDHRIIDARSDGWQLITMGLDASKLLLEQDKVSEARTIMTFLHDTFPKQLGSAEHKQPAQLSNEASSLELLQTLSLA